MAVTERVCELYQEKVDVVVVAWVFCVVHAESSVNVTSQLLEVQSGKLSWTTEPLPQMVICGEKTQRTGPELRKDKVQSMIYREMFDFNELVSL